MYLYYDSQNRLQEVINDSFLHECDSSNKIYIYSENWPDLGSSYPTGLYLSLKRPDGTNTADKKASISTTMQIPYDERRDLRFFSYGTDYRFFEIDLTNSGDSCDITVAGLYFGTPTIVNSGVQTVLNAVTFDVAESSVISDPYITKSQYAYILQMIEEEQTSYGTYPMVMAGGFAGNVYITKKTGLPSMIYGNFIPSAASQGETLVASFTDIVQASSIVSVGFARGSDGSDCEIRQYRNGDQIKLYCIGAIIQQYSFALAIIVQ